MGCTQLNIVRSRIKFDKIWMYWIVICIHFICILYSGWWSKPPLKNLSHKLGNINIFTGRCLSCNTKLQLAFTSQRKPVIVSYHSHKPLHFGSSMHVLQTRKQPPDQSCVRGATHHEKSKQSYRNHSQANVKKHKTFDATYVYTAFVITCYVSVTHMSSQEFRRMPMNCRLQYFHHITLNACHP